MLRRGQDIIGWQVLLQSQKAALITALHERAYVCLSTPARLSLSAKIHKTCNAMVCSAMEARCRSLHAKSGTDTSVRCAWQSLRRLSGKQVQTQCI